VAILRPGRAVRTGGRSDAPRRALRTSLSTGASLNTRSLPSRAQRIDKLGDVDLGTSFRDMSADRLPLGERLHPGSGQRCFLDTEARIDQHKALRGSFVRCFASRFGLDVPIRIACAILSTR
jgi:hypothetical protein